MADSSGHYVLYVFKIHYVDAHELAAREDAALRGLPGILRCCSARNGCRWPNQFEHVSLQFQRS